MVIDNLDDPPLAAFSLGKCPTHVDFPPFLDYNRFGELKRYIRIVHDKLGEKK